MTINEMSVSNPDTNLLYLLEIRQLRNCTIYVCYVHPAENGDNLIWKHNSCKDLILLYKSSEKSMKRNVSTILQNWQTFLNYLHLPVFENIYVPRSLNCPLRY